MSMLSTIRRLIVAVFITGALCSTSWVRGDTAEVNALRIEQHGESSSYVISKLGAVEVHEFMMEHPPRLVLDMIGAEHGLDANRFDGDGKHVTGVRTSQFVRDPDQITRVVFDLKGSVDYKVSNDEGAVTVEFFDKNAQPVRTQKVMEASAMSTGTPVIAVETPDATSAPEILTAQSAQGARSKPVPTPKPVARRDWSKPTPATPPAQSMRAAGAATAATRTRALNAGMQPVASYAANTGLVANKNITIDVQNADIKTVLRSVSEFSNTNIISGPEVEGKVTAHLKDVPWRQALDIVLKAHGFGWREEYGVIRVSTMERLIKEELDLQAADRKKDQLLPLVTQIVPCSYANAEEIHKALKDMLSTRGSMQTEGGNNALIVTDIQKNVDKIVTLVADLDQKIKQVEIVAKIVDVDYEASREMGIRWDALNLKTSGINGTADAIIDARGATPAGTFRVGTVQSWGAIQAIVDVLARENRANIISNPRIVTTDNREANILVGKQIPLIVSDEAGNPITELTKVGIILRVTPHVNKDRSITLDLHPEVSELSSQATVQGGVIISLSEADTRVVVGNGETAVIGGLINEVESSLEIGVPLLKDIPVIGNFFKLNNKTKKKREMIIFVTPTIIDDLAEN